MSIATVRFIRLRSRLRPRHWPHRLAAVVLALAGLPALAQDRLQRDGVVLYWGLVPAAIVAGRHPADDMHGALPRDGGQLHHLVIALFDAADGRRIADAVVRAQLHEVGLVDAAPKYLTPMPVDGQASYGQWFSTARAGPYRFRIFVMLPQRAAEIEFTVSARSPHAPVR